MMANFGENIDLLFSAEEFQKTPLIIQKLQIFPFNNQKEMLF